CALIPAAGRRPGRRVTIRRRTSRRKLAMKLRYFVVDARGQLRKASQAWVRELWEGRRRASDLGCPSGNELRLVSVVCDDALLPQRLYLLRLPLTEGKFTEESRLTLY